MDKEELEKFDKEQLDILLNDLQDIDKFTGFKNGAFKYELGKYQANLLINCIKKQKEVIDKAIEYINDYDVFKVFSFPLMKRWEEEQVKSSIDYEFKTSLIKDLKDILKEVSK